MPKVDRGRFAINYVEEGSEFSVLLIHGLAGLHRAWLPQIAQFRPNHRVVAIDNPGSGESSDVDGPTSMQEIAGNVLSLRVQLNLDKARARGTPLLPARGGGKGDDNA